MDIKIYNSTYFDAWNDFIHLAKNGTFLFDRKFMDYHRDRFTDHSLMIFDNQKLVALFPANISGSSLYSHQGLSYGGFLIGKTQNMRNTLTYFKEVMKFCAQKNINEIIVKQLPSFYTTYNHEEIDYIFFLINAKLYRVDIAYAIDFRTPLIPFQERRRRSIKKALKNHIKIIASDGFKDFWNKILTPNLRERFGVNPVHSLEEITYLYENNFPHIRQYNAYRDGEILAGCTIFETDTTAHAQYISASDEGRDTGAIDLLFSTLIEQYSKSKNFFDFGIVNESEGRKVNMGLLEWKEGFGAKAFAHRFFKINPLEHDLLDLC